MNSNVLVVGAGPAGVSCSYFLKKYDKENTIEVDLVDRLDKKKYELYHDCCGESVSKSIIDDIKPLKPDGVIGEIKKIIEHWPGKIDIETKMEGYLIDRTKIFPSIISEFEKIGGKYYKKSLKEFNQKNNQIKVKFNDEKKTYDYVVAADGANSLIRKKLGIIGRKKKFIQYIVEKESDPEVLEFFYDEKYEGDYKWIFPHEGKIKIGFPLISGKKFSPEGKILKKQSRAIGYGGVDKYVNGRILLIGDAACQTNPITKGGIRASMVAGKMAADAITSNNPKKYEIDWKKTDYASKLFLKSFEKLKLMNNESLKKHIEPFNNINLDSNYQRYLLTMKLLFKYPKYLDIYKAYDLSNKVGW
jgi:flavin-dependent dehydrogenase